MLIGGGSLRFAGAAVAGAARGPRRVQGAVLVRMGVLIGRDFPPLTNWARISIGTADEMRVANDVFKKVLAAPAATASR